MKVISTTGRGAKAGKAKVEALLARRNASYERAMPAARAIVEGVRKGGDAALRRYAVKFDGNKQPFQLRISSDEMHNALDNVPPAFERALRAAAANIRAFAEHQRPRDWDFAPASGVTVGQRIRPISNIGCYVPSGRYPLPSTLLMTVIPAQVAGVERIVVVSPRPAPETLAAAAMLGVTEFYRIGGAHAIAALAYGTKSIPRVDKIAGPGNAFVTAAKKLVAFDCAIDMLAGPTEIVVTSETGNPDEIASDLVAQAEHDPDAEAIFITTSADLASAVVAAVKDRVRTNKIAAESIARNGAAIVTASRSEARDLTNAIAPEHLTVDSMEDRVRTNKIAAESITRNGAAIVTASRSEARDLTNAIAPEHLTVDSMEDLAWVKNAGSVFIGRWSAQPLGDYVSGPNHTLPTCGLARVRGGLSVMDFLKVVTIQEYKLEGLQRLGPAAIALAEAEGLHGHAEAIRTRGVHA